MNIVRLITDEGYSVKATAKFCEASDQTVLNWHDRFTQFLFVNTLDAHVSFGPFCGGT
jgi:hypothetical protein